MNWHESKYGTAIDSSYTIALRELINKPNLPPSTGSRHYKNMEDILSLAVIHDRFWIPSPLWRLLKNESGIEVEQIASKIPTRYKKLAQSTMIQYDSNLDQAAFMFNEAKNRNLRIIRNDAGEDIVIDDFTSEDLENISLNFTNTLTDSITKYRLLASLAASTISQSSRMSNSPDKIASNFLFDERGQGYAGMAIYDPQGACDTQSHIGDRVNEHLEAVKSDLFILEYSSSEDIVNYCQKHGHDVVYRKRDGEIDRRSTLNSIQQKANENADEYSAMFRQRMAMIRAIIKLQELTDFSSEYGIPVSISTNHANTHPNIHRYSVSNLSLGVYKIVASEINTIPVARSLEDAIKLRSHPDAAHFRLQIQEWVNSIANGDVDTANYIQKEIRKVQRSLDRSTACKTIAGWTTYLSLPMAAVSSSFPAAIGVSMAAIGFAAQAISDRALKKHRWALFGRPYQ